MSGINEFTRYGRGEQLVDYYDSVGATPPNTINTMKKIAESIQMCNMYEFDSELKELRKEVANNDVSQPSLINIFWNQIRNDYGPLLTEECTGLDVVEWFYKKKFYQQAITYIEAKLPQELIRKNVISYEISPNVLRKVKQKLGKENYEQDENTIVNMIAYECIAWGTIVNKKGVAKDSFDSTANLKNGRNTLYQNAKEIEVIPAKAKDQKYGELKIVFKENMEDQIMDMILLYKLLKRERNNFNHMSEKKDRADQETLGRVINLFIKVGKEVYQA